jgi:ORF6N domain
MSSKKAIATFQQIESRIYIIRGHKVMLDMDLGWLYGVQTRALIQAVKRNIERFPKDFMFQVSHEEFDVLRSQSVISNPKARGGRRYLPYAFTEQGVAMLSSVLRSRRAVMVNVEIMCAFVHLRQMLTSHAELSRKLDELEKKYDAQFKVVFTAIRELMTPPAPKKRPIGFSNKKES